MLIPMPISLLLKFFSNFAREKMVGVQGVIHIQKIIKKFL